MVTVDSGGFADVFSRESACTVDEVELEDFIFAVRVPGNVAENGVHTRCCVGDEDDGRDRCVEVLGDGGAGFVEVFREFEFDEGARPQFAFVTELVRFLAEDFWEGAEGPLGCFSGMDIQVRDGYD